MNCKIGDLFRGNLRALWVLYLRRRQLSPMLEVNLVLGAWLILAAQRPELSTAKGFSPRCLDTSSGEKSGEGELQSRRRLEELLGTVLPRSTFSRE